MFKKILTTGLLILLLITGAPSVLAVTYSDLTTEQQEYFNEYVRTNCRRLQIHGRLLAFRRCIQEGLVLAAAYVPTPEIEWTGHYGSSPWDSIYSVVETSDEALATTGYANLGLFVNKVDLGGNELWQVTNTDYDWGRRIIEESDGTLTVLTTSFSYSAEALLRFDSDGNEIASFELSEISGFTAEDFFQTSDGGYLVIGYIDSEDTDDDSYLQGILVKLDGSGVTEWSATYEGPTPVYPAIYSSHEFYAGVETTDGYVIAGRSGLADPQQWILKVDTTGAVVWEYFDGGIGDEKPRSLIPTSDGGFATIGYTNSSGAGSTDMYFVKYDDTGVIEWKQTFGGINSDDGTALVETSDGYVLAGRYANDDGTHDGYLIGTDLNGDLVWEQEITEQEGTSATNYFNGVISLEDGSIVCVGMTDTYQDESLGNEAWIVKLQ